MIKRQAQSISPWCGPASWIREGGGSQQEGNPRVLRQRKCLCLVRPSFAQSRHFSFHHRGQPLHCRFPLRFCARRATCYLVYLRLQLPTSAVFLYSLHTRHNSRTSTLLPAKQQPHPPTSTSSLHLLRLSISTTVLNESCALILVLQRLATGRCGDFLEG